MTVGYIYKISFPNEKHYIGLTQTSIEQRTKEHKTYTKSGNTRYVYNALRKYKMIDTLELIVIDTADTLEKLCEKEIGYIIEYNSYYMNKNGYNMTHGGEGTNGYIYTEEDNKKNSERLKKYHKNNPNAGKEHSKKLKLHFKEHPEAIQRMSDISKKHWDNPDAKEKQSEILKLHFKEHPEAIQRISEISKKQWDNPDAKEKQSERLKLHFKEHPEAIQRMSEAQKKRFENPDAREQMSEISKTHWENPEARVKMREIKKKYWENPEAIQQLSEAQKKRFENPEARTQISESLKKYNENPDAKQKNSEALKKYYKENPDARKKLSDGKGKNKPFDIFTLDGTFIKTFTYQFDAKEYLQKEYEIKSDIKIKNVLTGTQKSSAGFVFKYK